MEGLGRGRAVHHAGEEAMGQPCPGPCSALTSARPPGDFIPFYKGSWMRHASSTGSPALRTLCSPIASSTKKRNQSSPQVQPNQQVR